MNLQKLIMKLEKSPIEHRVILPEGCKTEEIDLTGMVCDSRKATKGIVFAATKGEHIDAHNLIPKAAEAGASAVLCEHEVDFPIPQIICSNVRSAMGNIASILYGEPSEKLSMIAVTGTTGKTTSTYMTQAILNHAGIKSGLLGTVVYDDGVAAKEAEHTTPEGCDIQTILANMVKNNCKACVMEVSSHSLMQGRVNGLGYDRAGFTNLTQDHLDYHKTMENYFAAKRRLFDIYMRNNWQASVNVDDPFGRRLYESLGKKAISYSIVDDKADFFAAVKSTAIDGLTAEIKAPGMQKRGTFKLPVLGAYNVQNALQAISLAWSLGISIQTCLNALENMPQVPGRLECYRFDNGATCVIDFAHAPDGMEKVLTALRPVCKGRLIVVFGAGGDRDRAKRPMMGEIASRLCDFVVVTSDNPRTEEPSAIMAEIEVGVKKHNAPYVMVENRREGIYYGLSEAKADDIVAVVGRGPETMQKLKHGNIHLVDKEIMEDWLRLNNRSII